jgi:hypothetical protein
MKKILACFIAICFTQFIFSQEITQTLEYPKSNPEMLRVAYTKGEGGIVMLTHSQEKGSKNLFIHKYNGNFVHEWEKETPVSLKDKEHIESFVIFEQKIYLFYTDRKGIYKTYYVCYNLKGELLTPSPVFLCEFNIPSEVTSRSTGFHFTYSPNKSVMLVINDKTPIYNDPYSIDYFIFDADGMRTKGNIALTYQRNDLDIREVRISNIGNIFIHGYCMKKAIIGEKNVYRLWVYKWDCDAMKGTEQVQDMAEQTLHGLKIAIAEDETFYLIGIYCKIAKEREYGTAFYKFDSDNKNQPYIHLVPMEKACPELNKWFIDSKKLKLSDLVTKEIEFMPDGTLGLLVEHDFGMEASSRTIYEASSRTKSRNIYYRGITAYMNMGEDGKVNSCSLWTKLQQNPYDPFKSYTMADNTKTKFLFVSLIPMPMIHLFPGTYVTPNQENVYVCQIGANSKFTPIKPLFKTEMKNLKLANVFDAPIGKSEAVGVWGITAEILQGESQQISDNEVILLQVEPGSINYKKCLFTKVKIAN